MRNLASQFAPVLLSLLFWCNNTISWSQTAIDLEFQTEHTKQLRDIAFSVDRKYAATGSDDRTIKIWDLRSKKLIKTFRGHKREVSSVEFTRDGKYLLSGETGSLNGAIYSINKWDFLSGELAGKCEKLPGMVKSISVSPNNKYFMVELGSIFWTTYQIREVATMEKNERMSQALGSDAFLQALNPFASLKPAGALNASSHSAGKYTWGANDEIIAYYNKNIVKVWDFSSDIPQQLIYNPKYKIASIAIINSNKIIIGGFKGELEIRGADSKGSPESQIPLKGHNTTVFSIKYDLSSNIIVTRSIDGITNIWDTNGKLLQSFTNNEALTIYQDFTSDSEFVIAAGSDKRLEFWKATNQEIDQMMLDNGSVGKLLPIYYSGDSILLTYHADIKRPLKMWDISKKTSLNLKKDNKRKVKFKNKKSGNRYRIKVKLTGKNKSTARSNSRQTKMKIKIGKYHLFNETLPFALHPSGQNIANISYGSITINDIKAGEIIHSIDNKNSFIIDLTYAENGKEIIGFDKSGNMTVWRINDGAQLSSTPIVKANTWVTALCKGVDDNQIISGSNQGWINVWDLEKGHLTASFKGHSKALTSISYNKKNNWLASGSKDGFLKVWDGTDSIFSVNLSNTILDVKFYSDSSYIVSSDKDKIFAWDVKKSKKPMWRLKTNVPIHSIDLFPDRKLIGGATDVGTFNIWKFQKSYFLRSKLKKKGFTGDINNIVIPIINRSITRRLTKGISDIEVSPYMGDQFLKKVNNFRRAYLAENNSSLMKGKLVFSKHSISVYRIKYADLISKVFFRNLKGFHTDEITSIDISPDGNYLASGSKDSEIKLWELDSLQEVRTLRGHIAPITIVQFSNDGKLLYSADEDNRIKIWSPHRDSVAIATIISKSPEEYLIYTGDNYYYSSKGSAGNINFVVNDTSVFYFDQFDLKFNRPDIVLSRIGLSSHKLADAYKKAYEKRLEKMNMTEDMLTRSIDDAPRIYINNAREIPEKTNSKSISFLVSAHGGTRRLRQLNVWVNDVPIYGRNGLRLNNIEKLNNKEVIIDLSNGINRIQLSVHNDEGTESYRQTFIVECNAEITQKGNLYLVTIGLSKHTNPSFDLKYAAEDAKKITDFFYTKNILYDNIFSKQLLNEEVNLNNIRGLKHFLAKSNINDKVVIFISGHGILDDQLNYYIASHNMDFSNPKTNGIPFEVIESILDGLEARNKLVFIETCHAGEIDKESIEIIKKEHTSKGEDNVIFRSFGDSLRYEKIGLDNSFELMKELFLDLRRGTGAVAISSASGVEYSVESSSWNGGVMAYTIINGLQNMAPDKNNDAQISISELQQYLTEQIPALTNYKQHPTARIVNLSNDWRIW